MTHLEETDPLRFTLTQWHKSFGITVLFLAALRVIWRFTHKPPALPVGTPRFESVASHATHMMMYLLMVVIPMSGWVFVSVSPLNLETLLFGAIPWPHISFFSSMSDKEALAAQAGLVHMWLANTLLLLVLLHVCAAFFHQFVQRDRLISRMLIADSHQDTHDLNHGIVAGILLAGAAGLFLYSSIDKAKSVNTNGAVSASASSDSGNSSENAGVAATVGFIATQSGQPLIGNFTEVSVDLFVDEVKPALSMLSATVATATVSTGDSQMDDTVVTADWFAAEEYPTATFLSSNFEKIDSSSFSVTGELTIRGNTRSVEFLLSLEAGVGRGEFSINRSDFGVGDAGQDEFVDPQVIINFGAPIKTEQ